jgi:hypothetical protein
MGKYGNRHAVHTWIQKTIFIMHHQHQCAVKIHHFRLSLSTLSGANVLRDNRDVPFWNKCVWLNQATEWLVMIFIAQFNCPFCSGQVLSQSSWPPPVLLPLGLLVLPVSSSFIRGSQGPVLFSSSDIFSGSSIIHTLVSFTGSSISWYCWLWQHKLSKNPLQSFSYVLILQE